MKAIGVGCFWFSLEESQRQDFTGSDTSRKFLQEVKTALEKIDSVSNVEIDGIEFPIPKGVLDNEEDSEEFSQQHLASVDFDIYLPQRIQAEYGDAVTTSSGVLEHFHVRVVYEYDAPIVIINVGDVPDHPETTSNVSPSNAVASVRNYLREKLRLVSRVRLRFVGPSPMHVNIFVRGTEDSSLQEEEDVTNYAGGYSHLVFSYKGNDNDACRTFEEKYSDLIGIFYSTQSQRSTTIDRHVQLGDCIAQLLASDPQKGIWSIAFSNDPQRQLVDNILGDLILEKQAQIHLNSFIAENRNSNRLDENSYFWKKTIAEVENWPKFAYSEASDLVKIFEKRRQKRIANIATVSSGIVSGIIGILGGLIGALVGAGLTYQLSKSTSANTSIRPDAGATHLSAPQE